MLEFLALPCHSTGRMSEDDLLSFPFNYSQALSWKMQNMDGE